MAFTAGNVFLHRYSRETLVGLFVGLSMVNLWYSNLVSSRSFLAIGLIGGLAAAAMPMVEQRLALSVVLHFAIIVPSASIVARKRWSSWAVALWLLAMVSLAPAVLCAGDWVWRASALYGSTVLCVAAYCRCREWAFDPEAVFAPTALFSAALVGMFWIHGGPDGAAGVCVLGASALALGVAFRTRRQFSRVLVLAGVAIPLTVAPWGFQYWDAAFVFQGLGILCVIAGARVAPRPSVWLGWILLLLGTAAYLIALGAEPAVPWTRECALLSLTIAAVLCGAWGLARIHGAPEWIALGACLLVLPVFTRLAYVALNLSPAGMGIYTSLLIGWMIFGFCVNVFASRFRRLPPMAASWLTLFLALGFYLPLAADESLAPGADVLLIVGLMATTLITTIVARGFAGGEHVEELVLVAALLILPLFSRLAWVVAAPTAIAGLTALILAWMAYSLVMGSLSAWKRSKSLCAVSWMVLLLAPAAYVALAQQRRLSEAGDVALLVGLISCTAVATYFTRLVDDVRPVQILVNGAACLVLPLFSRLVYVVLVPGALDVETTLMIGWMSYSAAACAVAVRLRWNGTATLAGCVALLAGFAYLAQLADQPPAFATDLALSASLLGNLVLVAVTFAARGGLGFSTPALVTTAGFLVLPVFSRLAWLLLTQCGASSPAAMIFGWVGFSAATSTLVWRTKWTGPAVLSWLCIAMCGLVYGGRSWDVGFAAGEDAALLTAMLAATLGVALSCCRAGKNTIGVICVASGACWALFSRLVIVILTAPAVGMHVDAAATLSWSIYAIALMAWGFLGREKLLRYWSLAVFGTTLGKVVVVDMAALDPALRVGVLMVLGVAMLGVGYWYVRSKGLEPREGRPTPDR